ncbi:hypothetical protein BDZ45DRAFT_405895 [Acephala macrosclerotiorum]|nr:hypothetical protein BDZ45DRAFT_405895 [Acephala macrosclerotiorum]
MRPRVHCVGISMARRQPTASGVDALSEETILAGLETGEYIFMSNHPIHLALHICCESRRHYLARACPSFAFGTYVNFRIDTIYLPSQIPQWPDFSKLSFPQFLRCDSAENAQKVAIQENLLWSMATEEENFPEMLRKLRNFLLVRDTTVVFNDNRSWATNCNDLDVAFVDLSSRQKRKKAEISILRNHTKLLIKIEGQFDLPPMLYRYVAIDSRVKTEKSGGLL